MLVHSSGLSPNVNNPGNACVPSAEVLARTISLRTSLKVAGNFFGRANAALASALACFAAKWRAFFDSKCSQAASYSAAALAMAVTGLSTPPFASVAAIMASVSGDTDANFGVSEVVCGSDFAASRRSVCEPSCFCGFFFFIYHRPFHVERWTGLEKAAPRPVRAAARPLTLKLSAISFPTEKITGLLASKIQCVSLNH